MTASSSSDVGDLEKATSQPSELTYHQGCASQDDSKSQDCNSAACPSQHCHAGGRELGSGFRHCQNNATRLTNDGICASLAEADSTRDDQPSAVDRVLSLVASRSSYDPGPPPDGGWLAWTQCKLNNFQGMI